MNLRTLSPTGWLIAAGVASLVIAGLVFAVLAWGQGRYDAGAADADARWIEASRKLLC